ncbi:MAG: hypothetical protein ACFB2X_19340 [Rivularia sp. (in: cyanobacteria)]
MTQRFLNYELLESFVANSFTYNDRYPWFNFYQFLTAEGFQKLYDDFPSLELFEKHVDIQRNYTQRPHNRYYLAYEESIYTGNNKSGKGTIKHEDLPETWQVFIEELKTNKDYENFMKSLFDVSEFVIRYAWHMGFNGSEVSPHLDGPEKIGTHIFYFNTTQDWNPDWGGSILALEGKSTDTMNPDFTEFTSATSAQILDNHSFLFKNTSEAWHGVKALTCPEGKYRRLFNVIYEYVDARKKPNQSSLTQLLIREIDQIATGASQFCKRIRRS